jgi:hypothetical protein
VGREAQKKSRFLSETFFTELVLWMITLAFIFVLPTLGTVAMLVFEVDPYFYFYKAFYEVISIHSIVLSHALFIIRCFLSFMTMIEVCRSFSLYMFGVILFMRSLSYNIKYIRDEVQDILKYTNAKKHCDFVYWQYQRLRIIVQIFSAMANPIALFIMAAGQIVVVTCNFGTVKMYHLTPMPIYFAYPILSIFCPVFGTVALAQAIFCCETSRAMRMDWMLRPRYRFNLTRKYWRKRVYALNAIKVHGGVNGFNLYVLKRSTICTYWCATSC